MNKRKIGSAVLAMCSLSLAAFAQQNRHQLSAVEQQRILDGQFRVISTTEDIPANIKQAFSQITRQSSFALADPGQKYQVGDVGGGDLPFRRLLFAGVNDDKWFVHYERGGRGHGYYIVVFKVDSDRKAHFVWGGSGANGAKNVEQLRKMVAAGQFSDAEDYYW